jgi:hypothetical protein
MFRIAEFGETRRSHYKYAKAAHFGSFSFSCPKTHIAGRVNPKGVGFGFSNFGTDLIITRDLIIESYEPCELKSRSFCMLEFDITNIHCMRYLQDSEKQKYPANNLATRV